MVVQEIQINHPSQNHLRQIVASGYHVVASYFHNDNDYSDIHINYITANNTTIYPDIPEDAIYEEWCTAVRDILDLYADTIDIDGGYQGTITFKIQKNPDGKYILTYQIHHGVQYTEVAYGEDVVGEIIV